MSPLEITLLAVSILVITLVFGFAATHKGTNRRLEELSPPVLAAIRISLGVVFALLGVVGSLLPVMQGWVFFLLAVLVLFPQSRFAVRICEKAEPRAPKIVAWLRKIGVGIPRVPPADSDRGTMRAQ